MQAAVGCAQLETIDRILALKQQISKWYDARLRAAEGVILPPSNNWSKNVYWMYSVCLDESKVKISRDEVLHKMHQSHIEGRPFFYPIHTMPPYKRDGEPLTLKHAEQFSRTGISLPSYAGISEQKADFVCQTLIEIIEAK